MNAIYKDWKPHDFLNSEPLPNNRGFFGMTQFIQIPKAEQSRQSHNNQIDIFKSAFDRLNRP